MSKSNRIPMARLTILLSIISFLIQGNMVAQVVEPSDDTNIEKVADTKEKDIENFKVSLKDVLRKLDEQNKEMENIKRAIKAANEKVIIPNEIIKMDAVSAELKKSYGLFKFRKNKERKKKLLIHDYFIKLINEEKLKIDTVAVNEINKQFKALTKNLEDIEKENKKLESTIHELENTGDENEDSPAEEKANEAIVKYLKGKGALITEKLEDPIEKEKLKLKMRTDSLFEKISSFKNDGPLECDQTINKDSLSTCEQCIEKRINVMGWHNAWKKSNLENYYLYALSSLNYFGYELGKHGMLNRPVNLLEEPIPDIITLAHESKVDVYLTIFSKDSTTISNFLNTPDYQTKLILELDNLFEKEIINGVNINFEDISLKDQSFFLNFIKDLDQMIKSKGSLFKLTLTIPALSNEIDKDYLKAYNFIALNSLVGHYLVRTNRLINSIIGLPQSFSPLSQSNDSESGTIQSTIDYLINEKIPKDKMVITISYSGVEWEVLKSGDLKKGTKGQELSYSTILDKLKRLKDSSIVTLEGYDPLQASTYVYYVKQEENSTNKYKEIWFDGPLGLNDKYTWAINEEIGGIVIQGINEDDSAMRFGDNYRKLEKILTASVVQLDTCITKKSPKKDFWAVFYNDLKWAMLNEPTKKEEWEYKGFLEKDVKEIELEKNQKQFGYFVGWNKNYLAENRIKEYPQKKDGDPYLKDDPIFDTKKQCLYAFLRWRVYARIFLYCFLLFSAIALAFHWLKTWYLRYPPKNKLVEKISNILRVFFFITALFLLLGFLYFEPDIDIGGSENQWIALDTLSILLVVGCVFGIYIAPALRSKNLVRKNMP